MKMTLKSKRSCVHPIEYQYAIASKSFSESQEDKTSKGFDFL